MRAYLIALPLMLAATPAVAAPEERTIPPELSDPAMADQLGRMAGVLARSLMDLPIGELEAAVEGRPVTPVDRTRRVRDAIGGPEAQRDIEAKVAASAQQMRAMQKALVASLPSIVASLEGVERELERAVANLPDPTYPRR